MILTVNSDYFLKQRQLVDLCNGEVLCFLCGTDWILKYYLDDLSLSLRLQRVNNIAFETNFLCLDVIRYVRICWQNHGIICTKAKWLGKKRDRCCLRTPTALNVLFLYRILLISFWYLKVTCGLKRLSIHLDWTSFLQTLYVATLVGLVYFYGLYKGYPVSGTL
jgi:hypothetical protein